MQFLLGTAHKQIFFVIWHFKAMDDGRLKNQFLSFPLDTL